MEAKITLCIAGTDKAGWICPATFQNAPASFPFYLLTSLCPRTCFIFAWNNITCNHSSHIILLGRHWGSAPGWTLRQQHSRICFLHLDTWFRLSIILCSNAHQEKLVSDRLWLNAHSSVPIHQIFLSQSTLFSLILLPTPPVRVTVAVWYLVATILCKNCPTKFSSLMTKYFFKTPKTSIVIFLKNIYNMK